MADTGDVFKIPYDVVNEQILLAAALVDEPSRTLLTARIRPDMFLDDQHGKIWTAVLDADRKKVVPDASTLVQLSGGTLDKSYIDDLALAHPNAPVNVRHHLDAMLWDITRAKAVNGPLAEFLQALKDQSQTPERVRALASQIPVALQGGGSRKFLRDGKLLAQQHALTIAKRMQGQAVYPFGLLALDEYGPNDVDEKGVSLKGQPLLVPGAAPGKTTVITGISGGGKSTLTALLVLLMARQGRKVLYGAWEMGSEETLELLACISCGLSRGRVKSGRISPAEAQLHATTMESIAAYVKFVDMPFHKQRGKRVTHDEVLDEIHAYIADGGCEIAVFDLWRRAFRRLKDEGEEAEALYRQQAIFEETQVHGILVQQQRLKEVEKRANPRPTREGIKGSSAWVDIADLIIGMYLPALMKGTPCTTCETLILKQRYGRWPLSIEHGWDGDLVKLSNGRIVAYDPGSEEELGTRDKSSKFIRGGKKP